MGWVFEQEDIPMGPKIVLLALANHADHTTGYCWPSTETLMKEAACKRASLFSYIAALKRNGYLMSRQTRAPNGRGRANDYWILLDREPAPWVQVKRGPDEEKEILSEGASENESPECGLCENELGEASLPSEGTPQSPLYGPGKVQIMDSPLYKEPLDSNQTESEQVAHGKVEPAPPAPAATPKAIEKKILSGFDRSKRQAEQDRIAAADKARRPQRLFVFEGSDPWNAHVRNGHPTTLKTWGEINGKRCQGWYFPTLYPPKATGPPPNSPPESDIKLAKG